MSHPDMSYERELEYENARLREALERIAAQTSGTYSSIWSRDIARNALKETD